MKERLVEYARELGFDLCRIARCGPPAHVAEFREWLREGNAGEMDWLGRNEERRTEPLKVLPGAKSVIVLAMNYWQGRRNDEGRMTNDEADIPSEGHRDRRQLGHSSFVIRHSPCAIRHSPRIARYAWGDDYHDIIGSKLELLDGFLRERGGVQKRYVDTGPVLERDFAAEAGVGWHGKSTMLIQERLGTWFFLAEILTTLELEPDGPVAARCGSCTRCIDACPTAAITAPHKLDARRCISYLTIELKGSIPVELRPLIGDRIYGCDDCLDACPWNRFAQTSRETAFAARSATTGMTLSEYLKLSEGEFRTLFRRSPIKRIKRRGFLRNVCVALGNVGAPDDLPALERAAADQEPLIAEHALWAIERIRARCHTADAALPSRETSTATPRKP